MKRHTFVLGLALAGGITLASSGTARADGVVRLGPLAPEMRAALVADIDAARSDDPESFEAVAGVRSRLGVLDTDKRGRLAPIPLYLKHIGPGSVLPMLEAVAIDGAGRGDLTDTAWVAWRAGLIEAIGGHRDPRAEPVLLAVLAGPEDDALVVRAAAEALGKLGTDEAVAALTSMALEPGAKQLPVVQGMGACRRAGVAAALADVLERSSSPELSLAAIRSLGDLGNGRAWRTPSVAAYADEEDRVRATAAKALVGSLASSSRTLSQAASNALMVVDHAATPALLAAARASAAPEARPAFDAAAKRFARNPAR
jgi:HEAT repeat protein